MDVVDAGKTKEADRLLETQKIDDYNDINKKLPPGNKTKH